MNIKELIEPFHIRLIKETEIDRVFEDLARRKRVILKIYSNQKNKDLLSIPSILWNRYHESWFRDEYRYMLGDYIFYDARLIGMCENRRIEFNKNHIMD